MDGKKQYTQPRMELVSFSMSTSIAGSCRSQPTEAQANGWGISAWSADLCYHVPIEELAMFGS